MTDKERIERLIQTLMLIKQTLYHLKQIAGYDSYEPIIDEIMDAIEYSIQANADQINLDL